MRGTAGTAARPRERSGGHQLCIVDAGGRPLLLPSGGEGRRGGGVDWPGSGIAQCQVSRRPGRTHDSRLGVGSRDEDTLAARTAVGRFDFPGFSFGFSGRRRGLGGCRFLKKKNPFNFLPYFSFIFKNTSSPHSYHFLSFPHQFLRLFPNSAPTRYRSMPVMCLSGTFCEIRTPLP